MKISLLLVSVILGTACVIDTAAVAQEFTKPEAISTDNLSPYTVTYDVFRDGSSVGKAERTLALDKENEGRYVLKMRAEASILFYSFKTCESSHFLMSDGVLLPKEYERLEKKTFKSKKQISLEFDQQNDVLHGAENKKKWSVPLSDAVFDPLLVIEWLKHVAQQGIKHAVQANVFSKEKMSVYNFEFEGSELIKSPMGEINTVKFTRVRENSSRRTSLWFSAEAPFLPVQVRQEKDGEEQATMVITSFTRTEQQEQGKVTASAWKIDC